MRLAIRRRTLCASSATKNSTLLSSVFFFFQAEDGIRDLYVTGVQTCALPIYRAVLCLLGGADQRDQARRRDAGADRGTAGRRRHRGLGRRRWPWRRGSAGRRSEERRVGKEGWTRGAREY